MVPTAAQADDPNDPAMRSAAARARDRAIIRQLNLREAARVRERDAGYAQGWREWRAAQAGGQGYDRAQSDYARDRAQYERDMARWRRAVAACRAGDYSACDD
ncbi:MAG TPA: hypothetical protein VF440_10865 [Novosphingobium sp.]